MKSGIDKHSVRRYERVSVDISVRVVKDAFLISGRAHDLSGTGMSIYAPAEFAVGEVLRTEFTLPNSRVKFEVSAVVKNRIGFRYGLEFQNLGKDQIAEIVRVTGILSLTQE